MITTSRMATRVAVLSAALLAGCPAPEPVTPGCPDGQQQCGVSCRDVRVDPGHCGACGVVCGPGQVCSAGACLTTCGSGLTACAQSCRDLQTDEANCGGCGNACGAGEVCAAGTCQLSCPSGAVKCGGNCVDPSTSREFCGATGDCAGANAGTACGAGEVCSGGVCAVSCQPGLIECGGTCVDPLTSRAFCGATGDCTGANAGSICASGEVCSSGVCAVSCQSGLVECGGTCVDPLSSRTFCGATGDCSGANAGNACAAGEVCSNGVCALSCQPGLVECAGTCIDPLTSRAFCGATGDCGGTNAGVTCGAGEACVNGLCAATCGPGLTDCSGACRDLAHDPNHCGACGNACATPANSVPVCASSQCGSVCLPNFQDCNDVASDGCEADLGSVSHCGACGVSCSAANGTPSCANGACAVAACNPGFADCDGAVANGCEVNTQTNTSHCGACGNACGPAAACVGGMCFTATTCKSILAANPAATSGVYTLDPDAAGPIAPYATYCDMTTLGGGWTLLVNRLTMSDNLGQPDLTTQVGTFVAARNANFTFDLTPYYAGAQHFIFAVKHNSNCSGCTIAQYDSALQVPRSTASGTYTTACTTHEAVTTTKVVGPNAGTVSTSYRCPSGLGWGNCSGNVCHYGAHSQNNISDGSWSYNQLNEVHFPSAYSSYRSYTSSAGYCRSCGGGLQPTSFTPTSSTCCNSPGSPDNSTWTIWVR